MSPLQWPLPRPTGTRHRWLCRGVCTIGGFVPATATRPGAESFPGESSFDVRSGPAGSLAPNARGEQGRASPQGTSWAMRRTRIGYRAAPGAISRAGRKVGCCRRFVGHWADSQRPANWFRRSGRLLACLQRFGSVHCFRAGLWAP